MTSRARRESLRPRSPGWSTARTGYRPFTRQRVLEVIEAFGYVPDSAAQSMVRQRKEVIGLLAVESRSPDTDVEQQGLLFIEEALRGVESSLSEIEWSLLIALLRGDDPEVPTGGCRLPAKVDGMLIAEGIVSSSIWRGWRHVSRSCADDAPTSRTPTTSAPTTAPGRKASRPSGRTARQDKAIRHSPPEAPDARERRSALRRRRRYPGATLAGSFQGQFAAMSGQVAVRQILTWPRRELPDAIVCANDQMAIGAIRTLQTAGIRVPADIAVVGFDDMHAGALFAPPLTTVRSHATPGRARLRPPAAADRRADSAAPCQRLPTELIIRESCGCSGHRARAGESGANRAPPASGSAPSCRSPVPVRAHHVLRPHEDGPGAGRPAQPAASQHTNSR